MHACKFFRASSINIGSSWKSWPSKQSLKRNWKFCLVTQNEAEKAKTWGEPSEGKFILKHFGKKLSWNWRNFFCFFQDINRSLSFLRKNEKFSDLKFVCISYEKDGSVKSNIVSAHIALFRQISPLLSELFEITDKKQVIYSWDYNLISDLT